MRTVLVTGASGFIGSHLWETLVEQGLHVRCLVRQAGQAEHCRRGGAEPVMGDVTDLDAVRRAVAGVDVVFNLAGLTHARHVEELVRVNESGPRHVARACAEQAVPPCHLLVSSVAAAGPTSADQIRAESDPPAPVSQYGRSKLLGELAAREWSRAVPTTIVRPGIVFGPRDRGMLPILRSIACYRFHASPGWRSPKLSFIEVGDLIEILQRAARQGERLPADVPADDAATSGQGVYFGVAPEHLRYAELGRVLARPLLGDDRVLTVNVPPVMAWVVGAVSQTAARLRGTSDLLNVDKIREALVASWACSAAKLAEQLQFQPARPLVEQLQELARWYQKTYRG